MSEPNKVEFTTRRVIERKILESISNGDSVAILASKQDLETFIEAFNCALQFSDKGAVPDKWRELKAGLEQLRKEAYGKTETH